MQKILVVGQGIAGTVLALHLRQRGHVVTVTDAELPGRASPVAAGIINPVTGKRFAKSWGVEEFLPYARQFYHQLENQWGIKIFHEMPILRLFTTIKQENDWESRCALPDFEQYIFSKNDAGAWSGLIHDGFRFGELRQSGRVDFWTLLPFFQKIWQEEGNFLHEKITPQNLKQQLQRFDRVIFCTGFRAVAEPFFPKIQWQLAKGEVLIIKIENPRASQIHQMLKKTMMLVPLGDGRFWVGANYDWDFETPYPTPSGKTLILNELHEILKVKFVVEQHWSGVRPVTIERRPVWQWSVEEPRVGIFNGLGSKGALLSPFFAHQMAAVIE